MAVMTNNTEVKKGPEISVKPTPKVKTESNNTEAWLPVKNIQNGLILLDNGWKVAGVKITPRNIFILDEESQTSSLIALKNLYNTLDYEFWIAAIDKPVDLTLYNSQLELLLNSTQNAKIRKLIVEDLNKADVFKHNDVVDTEYYFLFQEKKDDVIHKRLRDLINGFTSCGLATAQTTNDDMRSFLDNFLNGGISTEFGTVLIK